MCTHHMRVHPLDPGTQDFSRGRCHSAQSCVCPLVCYVSLRNGALAGLIQRLSRGVSAVQKCLGRCVCAAYAW
jgi:hypothetical protein